MVKQEVIDIIYEEDKQDIYLYNPIVNLLELDKFKEELMVSDIYLPCSIRLLLPASYYQHLKDTNQKQIIDKISQTRKYTPEQRTEEFIKWIDANAKYKSLLDTERLENLNRKLNLIKEVYYG